MGTLLAALVIAYRDFRYVIGFMVQLWMFASPVAYPLHVVPEKYQLWYALNPMVGMIAGFRFALLGEPFPVGLFCDLRRGFVGVADGRRAVFPPCRTPLCRHYLRPNYLRPIR